MQTHALGGQRVLEMGTRLAPVLPGDAPPPRQCDREQLSPSDRSFFSRKNLLLNGPGPLKYPACNRESEKPLPGLSDLIVGRDLLCQRQQPAQLARFIDRHAAPGAQIIIVDPDRSSRAAFGRAMGAQGFTLDMRAADRLLEDEVAYKGRFLTFHRAARPRHPT